MTPTLTTIFLWQVHQFLAVALLSVACFAVLFLVMLIGTAIQNRRKQK